MDTNKKHKNPHFTFSALKMLSLFNLPFGMKESGLELKLKILEVTNEVLYLALKSSLNANRFFPDFFLQIAYRQHSLLPLPNIRVTLHCLQVHL